MAERGAKPNVHPLRARALRAISAFTSPLLPDDYLELINPLWSTRELRGRVEELDREAGDATTVLIRPGHAGPATAGAVPADRLRRRRGPPLARLLADLRSRPPGRLHLDHAEAGRGGQGLSLHHPRADARHDRLPLRRRGPVRPAGPSPEQLLFICAGSGITPIMCDAARARPRGRARRRRAPPLGADLRRRDLRRAAARTRRAQRGLPPTRAAHPRGRRPDQARPTSTSSARTGASATPSSAARPRCSTTSSRAGGQGDRGPPPHGALPAGHRRRRRRRGRGRHDQFLESATPRPSRDGSQPILVAGEEAGLELPFGCRMGICHTCVGKLCSGQLRDLRSGEVHGEEGEMVRTCVNAPEGPVEIEL